MQYYGDICSVTGEYEKDGQQKKQYTKIGAAFSDDGVSFTLKLSALPLGTVDKSGYPVAWVKLFPKKQGEFASGKKQSGGFSRPGYSDNETQEVY